MCGIFGFVGKKASPAEVVVGGLRRLEYRGYDSWGVAAAAGDRLQVLKSVGKISKTIDADLVDIAADSTAAIGHTRWATHGAPNSTNAHPHLSRDGRLAVVHNGIIENHRELRHKLERAGCFFHSQTDTETVVHLLDSHLREQGDFHEALTLTLQELRGAFGLGILDSRQPNKLFAVRMGSPLVVGLGEDRNFVSSDANALAANARRAIYLDDGEWAELESNEVRTFNFQRARTRKSPQELNVQVADVSRGRFPHYMLKEIYDQPEAIQDVLRGRIHHGDATVRLAGLQEIGESVDIRRVKILACGSSWHAGLVGKHYFEELARLPTEVEYASEFRYRGAVIEPGTLAIAISQSGETADTLAGIRESIRKGAIPLGIVNVVGSTIARECGRGVYLHAGPEFGVAATKSFTNQLLALMQLAIHFGRKRGMSLRQGLELLDALDRLPDLAADALKQDGPIRKIAEQFVGADHFLYVGRGMEFPIALEGALKLKEVSYIHAEGMAAAELKHGPIALVGEDMPTVVIATQTHLLEKIASNVQEIRARGGRIIAIATETNETIRQLSDFFIPVPEANDLVSPILATIPTQLLAYHLADLRGCDVDQPRNLAKSVTVE
ncbi:MAG TPA: glutamine--fructose-6-phosphate transaminase (isomerizing) [Planctomycetia bacterium]|nr:glutamine--fructose-6-phosphate transaminase (isomerizing) [Planctomycetia bacterium]